MSLLITGIIVVTSFLALYWVFWGQRKHNEMFMPKRKTKLKAVLFDFDGVIVDSFEAWFSVFNHFRKDLNLKEISREEFRKNVWGGSVEADTKNYYKNKDVKEIEKAYRNLIQRYIQKSKLLPDTIKVLKAIKNKKIKIGLVTNTFRKPTLETLKFHKIKNYFDAIVTSDDVEKAKPYPDSILKACEKLDVTVDEIIYVGDTKHDFKAGKAASCFVVGLNTHGDLIINRLSDLLRLI